jgi:hypothetical protein
MVGQINMAGISPPLGGPLRQPAERSFLKDEGILAQNISPLQVPCYTHRKFFQQAQLKNLLG